MNKQDRYNEYVRDCYANHVQPYRYDQWALLDNEYSVPVPGNTERQHAAPVGDNLTVKVNGEDVPIALFDEKYGSMFPKTAPVGSEGEENSFWEPYHEMCETLRELAGEFDFGAGKLDELVAGNYRKLAKMLELLAVDFDRAAYPSIVDWVSENEEAFERIHEQARQALNAASDSAGE